MMGLAKYYERKGAYEEAVDTLNEVAVTYSWFLPALAEKAKLMAKHGDWEQASEVTQKLLDQDSHDIEALRLEILEELTQNARPEVASTRLTELLDAVDRHEPKNARLYHDISRCFSRVCGGSPLVLRHTISFVERARNLDDKNSTYLSELGYQYVRMQDHETAAEFYQEAARIDESSVDAIAGLILCQLNQGLYDEASQQLDLFRMIQQSIGRTAELAYLDALLAWRKDENINQHVTMLDEARDLHRKAMTRVQQYGLHNIYDIFETMNPDFIQDMAKEYLIHTEASASTSSGTSTLSKSKATSGSDAVSSGIRLLMQVTHRAPGALQAHMLLARTYFAGGEYAEATRSLLTCLNLDPAFSDAYLLMAQVHLTTGDLNAASSSLDQALSHDFQVRNSPVYHLVKGKLLFAQQKVEEARDILVAALKIPGVRSGREESNSSQHSSISLHDRASIFVNLTECYVQLGEFKNASKTIRMATEEFSGTPEEVRIIISQAQFYIERGDFDAAIKVLNNVPPNNTSYSSAQVKKAEIYLKQRRDRRSYIKCMEDLASQDPTEQNCVLLGEAYMNIQMPDEAIDSFQQALERSPENTQLIMKVGRAMTTMHDYRRAVDYYESALDQAKRRAAKSGSSKSSHIAAIRGALTELYVKLKKFDRAEELIAEAQAEAHEESDAIGLMHTRDNLRLLSKVHEAAGYKSNAVDYLERAMELQSQIVNQLRSTAADLVDRERQSAADLCYEVGQLHLEKVPAEENKAREYFKEGMKAVSTHEKCMMGLAKLHLAHNELEEAQRVAMALKKANPNSEEAAIMLADLLFSREETEAAMYHFQQLLESHPTHYDALEKLITLLKRSGELSEAPRFLKLAVAHNPTAEQEPGYRFCKGLYHRYSNEPHEAIKHFNHARTAGHGDWAVKAIEQMVETYISPDGDDLWHIGVGEKGDEEGEDAPLIAAQPLPEESAVVAEKLLAEIPPKERSMKHDVLNCYILIALRDQDSANDAVNQLSDLLGQDAEYIPAILALATALMILEQYPKARNQLKRIVKMSFNSDYWMEFVRAWLMLADIYISNGKFDHALELCKRALKYDQSCRRAWEYLGMIMEKEQSYKDAADYYEKVSVNCSDIQSCLAFPHQ